MMQFTKAMATVESGVNTIKDDLLPPVAEAAGQARDAAIRLEGRVTSLEGKKHTCISDRRITKQEQKVAGLYEWKKYLLAIAIPVVLTIAGAAGKAIYDSGSQSKTIETNTNQIAENGDDIDSLDETLRAIRIEVKALPANVSREVKQDVKNGHTKQKTLRELEAKLTPSKRRALRKLAREAGIDDW